MNDNEELSFISLAAITANVARYLKLGEEQPVERKPEGDSSGAGEEKRRTHEEAVNEGLKRLAAFERRAAGIGPKRIRR